MRNLRRLCIVLLVLMSLSTGCLPLIAGAATGAGTVVFMRGRLKDKIEADVPAVRLAARRGLESKGLDVTVDHGDAMTAGLESEFADGKHVWIDIKSISMTETEIVIRVGLTGDEHRSRTLIDAIKGEL